MPSLTPFSPPLTRAEAAAVLHAWWASATYQRIDERFFHGDRRPWPEILGLPPWAWEDV